MIEFIKNPNLPNGVVKKLICGTEDKDILDFFKSYGISVIKNAPNSKIDYSVKSHADMAAIHLGKEYIIVDKKQTELIKKLEREGMQVIPSEKQIQGDYPEDIGLNFSLFNGLIFGKFSNCDKSLYEFCEHKKINVKQGYAKCSMLIVTDNAVVTDDEGIFLKLKENKIDCLLIKKGDIFLEGHNYGFIGGASVKIDKNTVLFFGDIKKHQDFKKIEAFLNSHGCKYVCTDSRLLRDIGGAICITNDV